MTKNLHTFMALQAVVVHVLLHPLKHDWEFQGFGFLRCHLNHETRLHVWSPEHANPGVSDIHDHLQWGLTSTIVFGRLCNVRYIEGHPNGLPYRCALIEPGAQETGGMIDELAPVILGQREGEFYGPGDTYSQTPKEIHRTIAEPGTVTVMTKDLEAGEPGKARVFWRSGPWGDAKPRPATRKEIKAICGAAYDMAQS